MGQHCASPFPAGIVCRPTPVWDIKQSGVLIWDIPDESFTLDGYPRWTYMSQMEVPQSMVYVRSMAVLDLRFKCGRTRCCMSKSTGSCGTTTRYAMRYTTVAVVVYLKFRLLEDNRPVHDRWKLYKFTKVFTKHNAPFARAKVKTRRKYLTDCTFLF